MTLLSCTGLREPERHRHLSHQLARKALGLWFSGRKEQADAAIREAIAARPQTAIPSLAFMVAATDSKRAGLLLRRSLGSNGELVRRIHGLWYRGHYPQALVLAENLVLNSSGQADAFVRACQIRLESGDHSGARKKAEGLVQRFPEVRAVWRVMLDVALTTDDFTTAHLANRKLQDLSAIDQALPTFEESFVRARFFTRLGKLDEAMRYASEAQQNARDRVSTIKAATHRARISRLCGNPRQAIIILEEFLEHDPGDIDIFSEFSDALRDLGHFEDAIIMARRALLIVPDHIPALRCLAHSLSQAGDISSSIDAFLHILDTDPQDQDAQYGIEIALDYGCVNRKPDVSNPSTAEKAKALWARGRRYRSQERLREAAVMFEQTLSLAPELAGAAIDLGRCLLDLGWPLQAIEAFEAARLANCNVDIEIEEAREFNRALTDPIGYCDFTDDFDHLVDRCAQAFLFAGCEALADPVVLTVEAAQLTTVSAQIANQRMLAEQFARTALEQFPEQPSLQLLLANCLVSSERYIEARNLLERLLEAGYQTSHLHYLKSICASATGEAKAAQAGLVTAAEMATHFADFPASLGDFLLQQDDPVNALKAYREAVRRMPSFALAHQNYAARYDHTIYSMNRLEADLPDDVLLADGYYRSGEKRLHVGDTEGSNRLYAGAIMANRRLGATFRLSDDLVAILGLKSNAARILPQEWVTQIGHLAMLDTWLKIGALGWRAPAHGIILAPGHLVANRAYLDCWRRHFTVVDDPVLIDRLRPLQRYAGETFNGWISADGTAEAFTDVGSRAYIAWNEEGRAPLLELSPEQMARGRETLIAAGMEPEGWFVALHIRNSGFHAEGVGSSQDHRNADLQAYQETIDMVTARGGWVIRMGDRTMPPLSPQDRVIDYAHSAIKSDWMDIFLCAAARCYLGTTSGLVNVAISYNTPCVLVNCISNYTQLWPSNVIFTWRPYWSTRENRYLSLKEILSEPVRGMSFSGNLLTTAGLIPRNNTSEDICSALEERLDELAGLLPAEREKSEAEQLWADATVPTWYFGAARVARSFAERTRMIFFPNS